MIKPITNVLKIISFINTKNYTLSNNSNFDIFSFKSINSAKIGDATFCSQYNEDGQKLISSSNATVIFCSKNLQKVSFKTESTLIFVDDPRLWFLRCLKNFTSLPKDHQIHSTAIVESKEIGKNVHIGAFTFIGKNVQIGDNSIIENAVHIFDDCKIGKNVKIQSSTVINSSSFGPRRNENNELETFPNLGSVIIEDDVEIGANTSILPGVLEDTVIGIGTKISDHVYIGSGMKIGKHCMITGHTYFGGSSVLEDYAYVAPGSIIRNGIKIGKYAFVGMGSVVTKNVKSNSTVIGNPAKTTQKNTDSNYISS